MPTIRECVELKYGKGLPKRKRAQGTIAVYGSNGVVGFHNKAKTDGETIIIGRKGTVGAVHYSDSACWPIDTTYFIDELYGLNPAYLTHALRYADLARLERSTAIPGLNRDDIYNERLPLAPRVEQDRIVAKVEELLDSVQKAKSRLERVPEIMENFRRSVLNAACSGRLTEDWREGKNTKDWAETSVKDVATKIQYGYTASSEKNIAGPRFLRITDIQKGKVNWDDVPSCKIDKRHIMKYQLETGDIVFARTGATTGKSFLIKECPLSIFASYLIRVKPNKKKILPEYLYIFFQSDSYWEQIAGKLSGSAQPNCNATKLSNLELFLPPLLEQAEIADVVEMFFELADKFEVRIKEAREKVVRITHSILAKAFRGELVPTEAELARRQGRTYETAEQLLARIKLEREKKRTIELKVSEVKGRSKVMGVLRVLKTRPILEVLSEAKGKLKPEELFQKAGFTEELVDDFYEELAKLVKDGKIEDYRPNNRLSILRIKK